MDKYRVKPNAKISLNKFSPDDQQYFEGGKKEGRSHLKELRAQLSELQNLFFVDGRFQMLIVLQAMDTGGKDGTIRHVFKGVNPQGVRVASFKKPTPEELSHDYLWRIHQELPAKGKIVIFNRSHYEDVLVPRVRALIPSARLAKRYDHINQFEKMLTDEGTTIVKFFLHINKDEQKARLQARLDNPQKNWKFNPGDLEERKIWNKYQNAYNVLLSKTSQTHAPWYIIPANRKWYRNIVISQIIIDTLKQLKLKYPAPIGDFKSIKIV